MHEKRYGFKNLSALKSQPLSKPINLANLNDLNLLQRK